MAEASSSQAALQAVGLSVTFGDVAVSRGFVTQKQVQECLDLQAELSKQNVKKLLGDILLERGYLLPHQIDQIREQQKLSASRTIDKYQVLGKLGEGGMGAVLKARRADGQIVAVKVLLNRLAANEEFLKRFYREARLGLTMDHPNVIHCLEVGEANGRHYMALEFVDGEDLGDCLQKRGFFLEGQALAIILAAARGMSYAHKHGLLHRDIKPANLMLTKAGTVKVMDFGLARADQEDQHLTMSGALVGTPHYMAPEQVEGKVEVDARADMYSLGVTLFHMLTGRPPYIGKNMYDILMAHVRQSVPNPRQYNTNISDETANLVLWMCEKDREKRLPSMERLIVEISRAMGLSSAQQASGIAPPLQLTTPSRKRVASLDAAGKEMLEKLLCPRCKAGYLGDPFLLVIGQRIQCESCGLVYPCTVSPPPMPVLTADDIELEPMEEPQAKKPEAEAGAAPAGDVDLTLQENKPESVVAPAEKSPPKTQPGMQLARIGVGVAFLIVAVLVLRYVAHLILG
jgi:serine/threonine protein kinase